MPTWRRLSNSEATSAPPVPSPTTNSRPGATSSLIVAAEAAISIGLRPTA
jgi:hypothetical protein